MVPEATAIKWTLEARRDGYCRGQQDIYMAQKIPYSVDALIQQARERYPDPSATQEPTDDDEFGPVDLTNVEPDKLPIKPRMAPEDVLKRASTAFESDIKRHIRAAQDESGMVPEAEVRRREREAYTEGHVDGWEVRDNNQTWTSKDTEQEAARRYPDPTATQEPTEPDPQRGPINVDAPQEDLFQGLFEPELESVSMHSAWICDLRILAKRIIARATAERQAGGAGCA